MVGSAAPIGGLNRAMPPRPKKSADEATPAAPSVTEKPKGGSEVGNAWSSRSAGSSAATSRVAASPSSMPGAKAKAAAALAAKTPMSIAAQAARNLGGFVPNKIFVGGVPITVTEEQFRTCFEAYGAIAKVELHALRGFGYVTYETVEAVDACLEKYEEHYLSKKWVEVKRSIPRELIDAYEREQRRLHTLHNESSSAVGSSATSDQQRQAGKADTASASTSSAPAAASAPGGKGAWCAAGTSSAASAASRPPAAAPPPGGASPPGGAWGRPLPPPGSTAASRNRTSSSGAAGGAPGASGGYGGGGGATPAGSMGRIAQLKEMGFSDEVSRRVLAECAWDVNKAIDRLLLTGGDLGEPAEDDAHVDEGEADGEPGHEENGTEAPAPATSAWQGQAKDSAGGANGRATTQRGPSYFPAESRAQASSAPAKSEDSVPVQPEPAQTPVSPQGQAGRRSWAAAAAGTAPAPSVQTPSGPSQEHAAPRSPVGLPSATTSPSIEQPAAVDVSPAPAHEEEEPVVTPPATVAPSAAAPAATEEPAAQAPGPAKRLERALRDWTADDASQLSVTENSFVSVWIDTATDNGWIHAELAASEATVGWLPLCVLHRLPEGQRWMRAKQHWEAMDASQCSVENGNYVIVWVSSLTKEGWTYVEADQESGVSGSKGWLPVFCLAWNDN
eukprot:TRINITY_DN42002_c0_g1_i1.p1 TRINITY_DN42002_c0_g1~~TRINITY_DN42002_c0_g1_i1.p1  ORF type:complete len:675 (+),score=125.33 TRINITY_DN42002_c0_g1_i1:34-2058(+)